MSTRGLGQSAMTDDREPSGTPIRALIGLLAIILLIVGAMFLVNQIRKATSIQDCVLSGRTNCAPINASLGR